MTTDGNQAMTASSASTATTKYDKSTWKLISQGAEARIWLIPSFLSIQNNNPDNSNDDATQTHTTITSAICKERFPKIYRQPDLDRSILKTRTRAEARCLLRCRKGGVRCPTVLGVDENKTDTPGESGGTCIFLEYISGITVRRYYEIRADENEKIAIGNNSSTVNNETSSPSSPPCKKTKIEYLTPIDYDVAYAVGTIIAKMHNVNIIHGDLTTSNMLFSNYHNNDNLNQKETATTKPNLVLIDFGLSGTAGAKGISHEEKAVDLYVLERAFEATHPTINDVMMNEILRAYKAICFTSDSVFQRLASVRLRGRKRECIG